MAKTTLNVKLSPQSLIRSIRTVEAYKRRIIQKGHELTERLALIGAKEASVRFTTAIYDGVNDSDVTAEPIENGWRIVARGQAVCFIEFGSGVYHNPAEPYPLPRPSGIVGIGEYGKGMGKRQAWGYYQDGELVITRGNPASMPMWYASQEALKQVERIAREVFAT